MTSPIKILQLSAALQDYIHLLITQNDAKKSKHDIHKKTVLSLFILVVACDFTRTGIDVKKPAR